MIGLTDQWSAAKKEGQFSLNECLTLVTTNCDLIRTINTID